MLLLLVLLILVLLVFIRKFLQHMIRIRFQKTRNIPFGWSFVFLFFIGFCKPYLCVHRRCSRLRYIINHHVTNLVNAVICRVQVERSEQYDRSSHRIRTVQSVYSETIVSGELHEMTGRDLTQRIISVVSPNPSVGNAG